MSIIKALEMGVPFVNNRGFPNCALATSQIGNSLFKTSVTTVEHCGPGGAFKKCYLEEKIW